MNSILVIISIQMEDCALWYVANLEIGYVHIYQRRHICVHGTHAHLLCNTCIRCGYVSTNDDILYSITTIRDDFIASPHDQPICSRCSHEADRIVSCEFRHIVSLCRNGFYVDPNIDDEKTVQLHEFLQLKQELAEQKALLEEKDDQLNRLHNIQKELLSYKKRVTKSETVYIVSTATYARQGIFKIGHTKQQMKFRSSSHNTTHVAGDKVKVLHKFMVHDSVLVENTIHRKLNGLLLEGEKEFFMCPYNLLFDLVELVIRHDDQENESVNRIIDIVYNLKQHALNATDWLAGIPEDAFNETLSIAIDDQKLVELDVTTWTRKQFAYRCVMDYKNEQDEIDTENFCILWNIFQSYLIQQLTIPKYKFRALEWRHLIKSASQEANVPFKLN
jgi:hypothetical protein